MKTLDKVMIRLYGMNRLAGKNLKVAVHDFKLKLGEADLGYILGTINTLYACELVSLYEVTAIHDELQQYVANFGSGFCCGL